MSAARVVALSSGVVAVDVADEGEQDLLVIDILLKIFFEVFQNIFAGRRFSEIVFLRSLQRVRGVTIFAVMAATDIEI